MRVTLQPRPSFGLRGSFFPRDLEFPVQNSPFIRQSQRLSELQGDEFTVIGGYESGVDAALNLVELGKALVCIPVENHGLPLTPILPAR